MNTNRGSPIEPIPLNDVLRHICSYLTLRELGAASRVSKHWRDVFRSDGAVEHVRTHIVRALPEWEQAVFENNHRYTWYKLHQIVSWIPLTIGLHLDIRGCVRRRAVMMPLLLLAVPLKYRAITDGLVIDGCILHDIEGGSFSRP